MTTPPEDLIVPDIAEHIVAYRGLDIRTDTNSGRPFEPHPPAPPSHLTKPPPRYRVHGMTSYRVPEEEREAIMEANLAEVAELEGIWRRDNKSLLEEYKQKLAAWFEIHKSDVRIGSGHGQEWTKEPIEARCPGEFGCPSPPCPIEDADTHVGFGCGIYACRRPTEVVRWGFFPIIAEVSLWGKVYVYERGYRAEYAQLNKAYLRGSAFDAEVGHYLDILGIPHETVRDIEDIAFDEWMELN